MLADDADKYALYHEAVINSDHEVYMLLRVYEEAYGSQAHVLREDFCGTGAMCRSWVRNDPLGTAYGVDLGAEPLAWGKVHNEQELGAECAARITLVQRDVREVGTTPPADVVSAGNYSYNVFTQRADLRAYLRAAWSNLKAQGVLLIQVTGGPQVITPGHKHSRPLKNATYEWETVGFNSMNHLGTYRINFHFPDGSSLAAAFEYAWRIWMPPDIKDLALECGFSRVVEYVGLEASDGYLEFETNSPTPPDARIYGYLAAIK